jgi:non-specific serine/threonine protein kinase
VVPREQDVEFSEWAVDLATRELRANGVAIPIGGRAFEIVEALVRSDGELVTKDELVRHAWPGIAVVEDATIRVHISAIRKALGTDRKMLQTVAGRGYRLVGKWTIQQDRPAAPQDLPELARAAPNAFLTNVPVAASALVGRETAVQYLCDLVSAYRAVTLTGPGGIGKTVLASEVARRIFAEIEGDVFFVELASLSDPQLVPSTISGVLGLRLGGEGISPASVARAIGGRKMLLVLDNCEHVIDAAAELAETLLRLCPHTTVFATSREVLRIEGEYVYQVTPLEVPSPHREASRDVLEHSAVQLFVARMGALRSDFLTHGENLPAIAVIVRRLDGIPLAIEFAAARAATLGIPEVAGRLDDRFALLAGGRRTALPRHQTLRATLDWSYELLPASEQRLLRRLAVFAGGFTVDAAREVMAGTDHDPSVIMDGVANLVDKSLIAPESSETIGRWRLLETTRAYAIERLYESGEAAHAARRHAEFYRTQFAQFASGGQLQAHIEDLRYYRGEIDNLRAALHWAFSPSGDAALGVELAAAAADFWGAMSLLAESCDWAGKALAQIGGASGTHLEMVLQCSLGLALIYTRGMIAPAHAALMRALALAQELGDFDYQQRATHDLWLFMARSAASKEALVFARGYEDIARGRDRHSQAVADWIVGIPLTYMAAHGEAAERLQRAIDYYPIEHRKLDVVRFGADLRASASAHLTVNLLSLGYPDTASRTALFSIDEARAIGHPGALCISLAWAAGFVFLSLDETDRAEHFGEELIDCGYKHSLRPFYAAGLCVRGSLAARRGDPGTGIELLRSGLAEMKSAAYLLFYPFYVAVLAAALGASGRIDEGLSELDAALNLAAEIDYRWFVPELLRAKGELLGLRDPDDVAAAEALFRRSMSLAHDQQALYWELCAAASLAELMRRQGRHADAQSVLAPVYDRLTDGLATSRVRRARLLLDQIVQL